MVDNSTNNRPITARKRFKIGEIVKHSEKGINELSPIYPTNGEVVGFSHDPKCVRVVWDNMKSTGTYHMDFIEKVKT